MIAATPGRVSQALITVCFLLILTLVGGRVHAADSPTDTAEEDTPRYQGSYWSIQGHMGYTAGLTEEQNVNGGPTFGLSLRLASVLSLADIQVTALASTYQAKVGDVDLDILRISTGAEVHLHPFFLMTLRNTLIWNWLAGIYASVGADLDLTQIGEGAIEPDFGWHTGVGMDIPLTPPEVGSSLWLGLAYRIKFLEVLGPGDEETNFNEHTIVLTIGYRDNDINFMRMPRPTELYESIKKDGE